MNLKNFKWIKNFTRELKKQEKNQGNNNALMLSNINNQINQMEQQKKNFTETEFFRSTEKNSVYVFPQTQNFININNNGINQHQLISFVNNMINEIGKYFNQNFEIFMDTVLKTFKEENDFVGVINENCSKFYNEFADLKNYIIGRDDDNKENFELFRNTINENFNYLKNNLDKINKENTDNANVINTTFIDIKNIFEQIVQCGKDNQKNNNKKFDELKNEIEYLKEKVNEQDNIINDQKN